jgi:hypothetical protein
MDFYPLGTFPERPPAWYAQVLEENGFDAKDLPIWLLSTRDHDMAAPSAAMLAMPPGYVLFRHAHPCMRFEVVVQGSLDLGDGRVARPGDVFTAVPDELYGPHTAGSEGCTTIEFFSMLEGMNRVLVEEADGTLRGVDILREPLPEMTPLPDGGRPRPRTGAA